MPACIGSGPGQHSQTAKSESVWRRGRRVSADSVHCYAGVAAAPRLALAQPVALAHQSGRPPSPARRFCCAALLADQNWWASGLRYRRSSNRASTGLYAENGDVRRRHHMRPQLADSAGRRSATNREQRCAALGAVALPAGTTVGQGHLPRVGDGDLFAADASALWVGLRCLWVRCARFNHGQAAYSRPLAFPRALPINPGRTWRPEHPLARLVGALVCCEGLSGSCHETVTSVKRPTAHDHSQGSHRLPRSPVGSWTTARSRRPVSRRIRLRECWRCRAASRGRDSRSG